jgi:hypothetical protein
MTDLKYPVKENGKEVEKSIRIPKYENSKYSDKEVMDIIREFFETYPDKALEYWSLVGTNGTNRTNGTVGTNGTNPYAPYNPWQTPRQMPQGQGPIDYRNPVNTTNGFFKK